MLSPIARSETLILLMKRIALKNLATKVILRSLQAVVKPNMFMFLSLMSIEMIQTLLLPMLQPAKLMVQTVSHISGKPSQATLTSLSIRDTSTVEGDIMQTTVKLSRLSTSTSPKLVVKTSSGRRVTSLGFVLLRIKLQTNVILTTLTARSHKPPIPFRISLL